MPLVITLIAGLLISGCSSEEKEPLNILGLTLDMTVAELYEKIEPHNRLIGASASLVPEEYVGMYRFTLTETKRLNEKIVVFVAEPHLDEKPLSIQRDIWTHYDNVNDFDNDDIFNYAQKQHIEKFGEPVHKKAASSVSEDMVWTMSKNREIKKCGSFENPEKAGQSIIDDGCESILALDFYDADKRNARKIYLRLDNIVALIAYQRKAEERYVNEGKSRF